MRALATIALLVLAAGCTAHRSTAAAAPRPTIVPDSTFLRLCAEPPKPAPGGGVGCLMRIQIF